jgi:hypothetical protein
MIKYKLVRRPERFLGNANLENNLSNLNGYLVNDVSLVDKGVLVNEYNVNEFLSDPNNAKVIERFKKYIKEYTDEMGFKEIYYTPTKVAPILNDYYNEEVRFNSEANPILILNALKDTQVVHYVNNNFDFLNNKRIKKNESKLINVLSANTRYKDYYIDVSINVKEDSVYGTDYSKYFNNTTEDGVVYVNSFVDLNKKSDPFEYWTNNKYIKRQNGVGLLADSDVAKAEEKRVKEFTDEVIKAREKLQKIQLNDGPKYSIEQQTQEKKLEQAQKVLDKVNAKYKRKKSFEKELKKRKG